MTLIICEDLCRDCRERFLKDPANSGDYSEEGVLLRFCPGCGQMLPYLKIEDNLERDLLSRGLKRRILNRIATKNGLDHKEMDKIRKNLKEVAEKSEFIMRASEEIGKSFGLLLDSTQIENLL